MPEYLSPGVYVEEIPSANKPIAAVGTSTGAFVGLAEKGPIGVPVVIGNRSEFFDKFGGYISDGYLAYAVNMFFQEGGIRCYVVRTCGHSTTTGDPLATASTRTLAQSGATGNTLVISAVSPGSWGDAIAVALTHEADATRFTLQVYDRGELTETYESLVLDPDSDDSVEDKINDTSKLITVNASTGTVPGRPDATTGIVNLQGGNDGLFDATGASVLRPSDFLGVSGLEAFNTVDTVNIVAIPDSAARDVMMGGIDYCSRRKDCFFVAHATSTDDTAAEAVEYKQATGSRFSGQNAFNSSYGALYVPWLVIADPLTKKTKMVPPSGAVAGRYSATDVKRGVHKVAAGVEEGRLLSVLGLSRQMTRAEMEVLNPKGVNVIRFAEGVGNLLWGARTVSADPEWRYVNVRRLMLFIEKSIENSTKWTVFEPNEPTLWKKIERNVAAFLRTVWRTGALFGAKEEDAFYVKCDNETNPQESIDLGRVVTEIGVAIAKPAEFVIFRISQWSGGTEVSE